MSFRVLNHVGIVVPDIAEARERVSDMLRVDFTRVVEVQLSDGWHYDGRDSVDQPLKLCYSLDGPPYVELLEATEDLIWQPTEAGKVHHFGYIVNDVEIKVAELAARGVPSELLYRNADGRMTISHSAVVPELGARIEYLDSADPSFFELFGV